MPVSPPAPSFSSALSLSAWHASPLTAAAANERLEQVRAAQQYAYSRGQSCSTCAVHEMVARFWLERDIEAQYRNLCKVAVDVRAAALVELVYGQLRISRKLSGSMEHLRRGFALASGSMTPDGYFIVLRRHNLLAYLPLSERAAAAQDLDALLREAGVIRALKRGR